MAGAPAVMPAWRAGLPDCSSKLPPEAFTNSGSALKLWLTSRKA